MPEPNLSTYEDFQVEVPTDKFPSDGLSARAARSRIEAHMWTDANPMLNGYMPTGNSRALTGGVQVMDNAWFDTTSYRGGFDGMHDWTTGWTHQVTGGQ